VFYAGPSVLDGAPIVGIVTGLKLYQGGRTENPKTGAEVVQTWILRQDVAPHDAIHSGEDSSICGECPLRPYTAKGTGKPVCYASCSGGRAAIVNTWRSFDAGNIPQTSPECAAEMLSGRLVRLGSYGDPAAIPLPIWEALLAKCGGSIGYTHQWRICDTAWSGLVMASVETPEQREEAHGRGYRTFRVESSSLTKLRGEVVCPGSEEAGRKLTCGQCMACNGRQDGRRGDIVITAHGPGQKREKHGRA
jgi:hypothetical protein